MSSLEFDEKSLVAALRPLGPYLDQLVVCGGWTLRVYRSWILKDDGPLPMATADVDLAVPSKIAVVDRRLDLLLVEAGFKPNFVGWEDPTVSYVKEGAPEIEFVTPRKGDRPPKAVEVQPGVKAEPLRFLEVVLDTTRVVDVPGEDLRLRVPTPEAYFYQKGLSFPRRRHEAKKAKDLAYMFELLNNFPSLAEGLPAGLGTLRKKYPAPWFATFRKNLSGHFRDVDAPGPDMVAGQMPHPHDEMKRMDPAQGPGIFRRLVRSKFRDLLERL